MATRSVVSLGVSVDRDTVHGVALTAGGDRLPDRVRARRTEEIGGARGDLTAAIETVLSDLADAVAADCDIAGVAVAYRDAAERRAVVTGLAAGPWHDASLVSVRSAHLALAAASSWMSEFDYVVVCEVGPGLQAFSLIGPERDRVVAAITTTASVVTDETMGLAIAGAWDQFDAAEVRPDAVVVVGATAAHVTAALESGFAAPVIPCVLGEVGPAAGAALVALPDTAPEEADAPRGSRRGVVLLAAAGVLAGGLAVTGGYELGSGAAPSTPVRMDAHGAADDHGLPEGLPAGAQAPLQRQPSVVAQSDLSVPEYVPMPSSGSPGDISSSDTDTSDDSSWDSSGTQGASGDSDGTQAVSPEPQNSDAGPAPASGDSQSALDGSQTNSVTGRVSPNSEQRSQNRSSTTPPAADFGIWWETHWPQMVQWALTPHA